MRGGDTKRTIKLYCPSLSKIAQLEAWDEQRLDLGSIARAFGLEPATLKLNGHFISRGLDLIASSVTWKSLLSFFSARGLSTGATHSDALIVDGRLSKVGSKRPHAPAFTENGTFSRKGNDLICIDRQWQPSDEEVISAKRLKDNISAEQASRMSLKRRLQPEDPVSLKRTRANKTDTVVCIKNDDHPNITASSQLSCSSVSQSSKRMREDEMLLAAPGPCKRARSLNECERHICAGRT